MNQFKYFIFVILYIFLLKQGYSNYFIFICLSIISSCFVIKHIKIKKELNSLRISQQSILCEQRKKFIDSLSHDLRIPVLAQLRALEFLNIEQLGELNSSQKDILKQTINSCRCVLNLISLMISTYEFENNIPDLSYQQFNIYNLVTSCFMELKTEAADKNLTFEYECDNKKLCINANQEEIRKVLINLILTFIMYSKYGGKIVIKVLHFNNKLRFSINCDGENACLFDMKLNSHFTFIGESIRIHFCKKIIETHNGHVINSDNTKDLFAFELPMSVV